MKYFSQIEQQDMLAKFVEFDQNFTNQKYEQVVKIFENEPNNGK